MEVHPGHLCLDPGPLKAALEALVVLVLRTLQVFEADLTPLQQQVLMLLGVPESAYRSKKQGG